MVKRRKKLGLALGGGGARGLAHIGVIETLVENQIPVDYIAGTSIGAVIGGWYALKGDVNELKEMFLDIKPQDIFPTKNILLNQRKGIVIKGESVHQTIERIFGDALIEDCRLPFAAIATDVKTGEEVILNKGNLSEALKASTSIPFVFNPISLAGRLLMDGGASNPVPADVVRKMGAELVIAVDVSSRWLDVSDVSLDFIHFRKFFTLIASGLSAITYQMARKILEQADIVLRPAVIHFDLLDFDKAQEIIRIGRIETKDNLEEICRKGGYELAEKSLFDKLADFVKEVGGRL